MTALIPFLSCRSGKKKRRRGRREQQSSLLAPSSATSRSNSQSIALEVIYGFDAKIEGTLEAKPGDIVRQISAINGWLQVRAADGRQGYIPAAYCAPIRREVANTSSHTAAGAAGLSVMSISSGIGPSIGRSQSAEEGLRDLDIETRNTPAPESRSRTLGTAIAVFDFLAEKREEVSMLRGDRMIVLKDDDPDWLFVETDEGFQGMVPKSYVFRQDRTEVPPVCDVLWIHEPSHEGSADEREWYEDDLDDDLSEGIETDALVQLVAMQDYQADEEGFLSVNKGEILYTDISDKRDDGWLKVHSVRQGKGGLIPSLYARTSSRPSAYVSYRRSDSWDNAHGVYTETQV